MLSYITSDPFVKLDDCNLLERITCNDPSVNATKTSMTLILFNMV